MTRLLARHWFLVGLALVVVLAVSIPRLAAGDGWTGLSRAKPGLVALIFVVTGLLLDPRSLLAAAAHYRLHLVLQGASLGLTPLLVWSLQGILGHWLGADLALGLAVLAALPTTITSNVVLTTRAGGNVAAAVCNAALGNLLGVVLSPLWITLMAGAQAELPLLPTMIKVGALVLLPLIVGQLLRRPLRALAARRGLLGKTSNLALLLIVLGALSDAALADARLPSWPICLLAATLAIVLHLALLPALWYGGRALGFDRGDRIALTIGGSEKTLALGIPLLSLLFAGDPRFAAISLPLLVYHPAQLLIDGLLAERWRGREAIAPGSAAQTADSSRS